MDVAPVDVVNPGQFCCHVVQNGVEFKRLTEELINCYSKSSVDQSIRWQKLMPCVALYDGKLLLLFFISISYCKYNQLRTPFPDNNFLIDVTY